MGIGWTDSLDSRSNQTKTMPPRFSRTSDCVCYIYDDSESHWIAGYTNFLGIAKHIHLRCIHSHTRTVGTPMAHSEQELQTLCWPNSDCKCPRRRLSSSEPGNEGLIGARLVIVVALCFLSSFQLT